MACSLSCATLVRGEVDVTIGVAIVREGSAVQADIHVHSAPAIHTPHGTVVAITVDLAVVRQHGSLGFEQLRLATRDIRLPALTPHSR
jgi:hypothetical protein